MDHNNITSDVKAFIESMPKKQKPAFTTDHYPSFLELHCYECLIPTEQRFEGMLLPGGVMPKKQKDCVVCYICPVCKSSINYRYCPPGTQLKFVKVRV